jgi:hypothetical protein
VTKRFFEVRRFQLLAEITPTGLSDKYDNSTPLPIEKCNPETNFKNSQRYKDMVQI